MHMRRTKKITLNVCGRIIENRQIVMSKIENEVNMMKGMIKKQMKKIKKNLINFRIFAGIIAHAKKCGFYAILIQYIQYPRGNLGNRTIVKCEIHTFFVCPFPPDYPWKKCPVKPGRLFDKHNKSLRTDP